MSGDVHVRFCERLEGRFLRATRRNIFVRTPKAAERVMARIGGYIEKRLKLVVNREKSQVARSDRVKFLGMTIVGATIAISHKALQSAMAKVKELTPRGTHLTLEASIERINSWYVGWSGYFAMTYYPAQLHKIEAHIRRRLRSRLVDQQKSRRNLFRKLIKRGVPRRQAARAVFSNKGRCSYRVESIPLKYVSQFNKRIVISAIAK